MFFCLSIVRIISQWLVYNKNTERGNTPPKNTQTGGSLYEICFDQQQRNVLGDHLRQRLFGRRRAGGGPETPASTCQPGQRVNVIGACRDVALCAAAA